MKLPTKTVTQKPVLEPSFYIGVLVQLVDLGTQETSWMGEKKALRKIRLGFEIMGEKAVFSEEKGEQPFMISRELTASMASKANLRKMIDQWRGRKLTDEEAGDYDLKALLGKSASVNISQYESKTNGLLYNSVESLSPVPKAMATQEFKPENPLIYFNLEEPDWEVFNSLPTFYQEMVAKSPEYKGAIKGTDEPF